MFGFSSYFIAEIEDSTTVSEAVHHLSKADLIDCFGGTILGRGRGYHRDDRLIIEQEEPEQITGKALGTRTYETKVFIEDDTLQGQCNCPYEAACKHLAALLLTIQETTTYKPSSGTAHISNEAVLFAQALEAKSKEDLVDFLKKHATPEQKRLLRQKSEQPVLSEEQFYEWKAQIEQLLQGKNLESSLLQLYLKFIQPYWTKQPYQVAQMLHNTLGILHEKLEDVGRFSHNSITPYYQLGIDEYVTSFLLEISNADLENIFPAFWLMAVDKEVEFNLLLGLPQALIKNWPSQRSLQVLKSIFLSDGLLDSTPKRERLQIFEFLRPVLSQRKVLSFLERLMSGEAHHLGLYVQALIDYGEIPKAIQVLDQQIELQKENRLFKQKAEDIYELRIKLAQKHETNELAQTWCKKYIKNIATERSLNFAIQSFPTYQAWFETLMEERSPVVYLSYLENKGQITEAAALFDKYPKEFVMQSQIIPFFARHKDQFPIRGLKALESLLEEHLHYTSEDAYRATAQVLLDIQSIEPAAAFQERLAQIKNQFKRRRNLMKILVEVGL